MRLRCSDMRFALALAKRISLGRKPHITAQQYHSPQANQTEKTADFRQRFFMARLAGFEPATYRFVAGHSIH